MRYLLDTHILLWALKNSPKLSKSVKLIVSDYRNELWFSPASIWEVGIKLSNEKVQDDDLVEPFLLYQTLLQEDFKELKINSRHAIAVRNMQKIHKDPFDRILIAQAKTENLVLITVDDKIKQYDGVPILMA
ncbi:MULTISPECIES: type II toxin-antitoxin system VapC family toxin [unclassified Moraxella]|uniref:type II toxin-antitoxin system VapC family toxin n=1 Tax=unclassified Moraxella TaxID=2685852 RepID=UPI002B4125A3|nr:MULTISPECIES: type II toxin-antitoxin system VapC family toxin [unclassified Moraxella]